MVQPARASGRQPPRPATRRPIAASLPERPSTESIGLLVDGLQLEREPRGRGGALVGGGRQRADADPQLAGDAEESVARSAQLPAGGVGSLPRKRGEARTEESGTVVGMASEVFASGLEAVQNCAALIAAGEEEERGAVYAAP